MLNFNTQDHERCRSGSYGQAKATTLIPNYLRSGLAASVVALLLCCFSFQSATAQCNIATPSGTDIDLYLGANGNVELNSNVFIPFVSSPNCPNGIIEIWVDINATIPFSPTTYDCSDEGDVVPVFVTIEGPFSQSTPVLFTVNIVDNAPPLVAWPSNVTVNADPNACAAVVNTLTPVVLDNCPGSWTLTWVRSANTPGAGSNGANGTYNVGTTTVTWTLVDANGTPNQVHQTTVTVNDSQPPTFTSALPGNAALNADASCVATHNWTHPSVTDNCGLMTVPPMTYTITYTGATPGGPFAVAYTGGATSKVFNKGVTTCTYSMDDDGAGPHAPVTYSFTVIVTDITLPSFGIAPTVSTVAAVGCSAPVSINLNPFITDNCSGTITKTFTVTSASSGSSPYPLNVAQPGAQVNATFLAGVYTIVFRATDVANNLQTHTLTLSVLENTAPVAACQDFTAYLGANGQVVVNAQSLDDGSTDNCAVTVYELSVNGGTWGSTQTFDCSQIGTFVNTLLRVKDAAGNVSPTCGPVNLTIADAMAPVAQCKNISVNLDQMSNTLHTVTAADINNMSYDNCTNMASLTLQISEVFAGPYAASIDFDCFDVTTNSNPAEVVYLRVTDAQGNVSNICSAQVTVNDITAPNANGAPYLATLSNVANGGSVVVSPANVSAVALSTDNCTITKYEVGRTLNGPWTQSGITYTCADLSAPNPDKIYIRVTDADNNTNIDSTFVTIQDIDAPNLVCPSTPINLLLDASGNATILASTVGASSTDNCAISLYEIRKVAINPAGFGPWATSQTYTCDDVGLQTVRLRAQDSSGNPNPIGTGILCANAINVVDNIAPVAICNSVSVALGSNGQVTIPASSVSLGSTDNCFSLLFPSCGLTREISKDNGVTWSANALFACSNLGANNLIKVRITDCHGNDAICTTNVTIQDNELPVVTAPADITVQCSASLDPTVNLSLGSATATDNCTAGTPTYSDAVANGSCAQGKIVTRTWKSTDQSGNMGTDVQIITVIDNTAPSFTAPTDKVLDCPGSYTVANQVTATFTATAGLPLTISPVAPGIYEALLPINVASNGRVMDINIVDLVVEHDFMDDIDILLISPTGVPVTLVDDFSGCGNVNNLDINYDDEAPGFVLCNQLNLGLTSTPLIPFSLSNLDGQNINGTWKLRIIDNASGDGGALVSWGLEVTYINQPNDLSLTGSVVGTDNCDPNPTETFADFHAYKDFISHDEAGGYDFSHLTDWTSLLGGGTITPTSTTVNLVGANAGAGNVNYIYNFPGSLAAGFIVFDWTYTGATPASDPFVVEINGAEVVIKNAAGPNSGRAILPVPANPSSLVFRQKFGGNSTTGATLIQNFLYYNNQLPVIIDGCERKFCVARVWNVADACGNAPAKQVQVIETRDITAPVVNYPMTKTVLAQAGTCTPLVDLNLSAFISDACSSYSDLIITNNAYTQYGRGNGTDNASGFYPPGSYSITFTAIDECGNVKNHTVALTVIDAQNPTAICQNATIQLDNTGTATLLPTSINNGSYDNCSVVGMSVSPNTFTTADIGQNTVVLTVTDPAGQTNSCTGLVTVLGGVMFDAADASGATGSMVLVPVTVTNFNNIVSFDLDLDIATGTVATVNAIQDIHPSLSGLLYPITSPTHVDVSWIGSALTLPAGTVAFKVKVNLVGATGSSTPIIVDVNEVGTTSGITPSVGLSGTISIVDPNTLVSVSGVLQQASNCGTGPVNLVNVDYFGSVNGTFPNAPGAYSFNVPSGSSIIIAPEKNVNWNNGVTTTDALCVHYYSIGLPLPAGCPASLTAYQKIAADANANDVVTAFDASLIQQIAVNNTPVPGNSSWRFVPSVPALPSDPFALGFDEVVSLTNITTNTVVTPFIGIKTGDVNCSAGANLAAENTDDRSGDLILQVSDIAIANGQDLAVSFKASDFNSIFSMQTTLNFDPSKLVFVGATGDNLSTILFNSSLVAEGKLALSWYNLNPVTVANGEALFTLQFKALGDATLSEMLATSSDVIVPEVMNVDGTIMGVGLAFDALSASGEQTMGHYALHQNRPNPFGASTAIGFNLPQADHATLTITDASGKVLKMMQGYFTAGYHQFMVERKDLPSTGMFFYQLKTADFQAVKKMVLVD